MIGKLFASLTLLLCSILPLHAQDALNDIIAIDINHASAEQLTALKGIGDTKSQAIVNFREIHGLFKAPEDIVLVPGIGEKIYEANKAIITAKLPDELTLK